MTASNDLTVICIQSNIVWEDIDKNILNFENIINQISHNVDVIILPEFFTTGFSMATDKLAENMYGKTFQWLKYIAIKKDCCIVGSYIVSENNNYYNRLIWMYPDGEFELYDKRHLFRMSNEHKHFTSGNKKTIAKVKDWKICLLTCYDIRFPVWSRNTENYDVVLYIANFPLPRAKQWEILLQARAIENQAYSIGVNRIGIDGMNISYSGNTLVVNPIGEITNKTTDNSEELLIAILSKDKLTKLRDKFPVLLDKDNFDIL